MEIDALSIPGACVIRPRVFPDDRGEFAELYRFDLLSDFVGHPLNLAQWNTSRSRRGSLRGIHYSDLPRSQAKYVTCAHGTVLDVIVDVRTGSPTFGQSESILLKASARTAVYLPEGLGHALFAIDDDSVVTYICSNIYDSKVEHGINPLDPDLQIEWPDGIQPLVSPKDLAAPSLKELLHQGLLPSFEECQQFYAQSAAVAAQRGGAV